ncbi:ATP synthase delta subunit [Babesia ovata]|uniref:ATP synthase delta subunit n=1 Tax=Babesia ovata TaxID=189622 RepID=A0A2H6KC28_9APIC|nr:ATP synthase delta subunit [Babesia ovata]GBE60542.1 ATP synthase delta subunit [Babesia ovata]
MVWYRLFGRLPKQLHVSPPLCGTSHISHRHFAKISDAKALEMMDGHGVMGSYAKALYLAAKDASCVDSVMGDLSNLHDAMSTCDEFAVFISNPCLRSTTKVAFLRDDLKTLGLPAMQKETLNCLEALFTQRRSGDFPELVKLFETLYMATKGQVKCYAHSAFELSPRHKSALENALKKRLGGSSQPSVMYKVSPSLMGGLVVRIGDQVIDASVSTKLDRMHSRLSSSP